MHCLSAQALISYPDLTLFFGRGRSGYEITQAPLVRVSEGSLFQVFRLWGRRWQMRAGF